MARLHDGANERVGIVSGRLRVAYVLRAFPRLSETFILGEIVALMRRGVDVRIFALERAAEPLLHPAVKSLLPRVVWVPEVSLEAGCAPASLTDSKPAKQWAAGQWIGRILKREPVHHIHAHFAGPAAIAAAAAAEHADVPFSFTAHAKDIFSHKVDWAAVREISGRASAVITVCEHNRRFLRERLGHVARIERIYNGVDLRTWRPERNEPRRLRIAAVGRLVPKKGFHVLLDACALLRTRGRDVETVIVGDGAERAALESQSRALGLNRAVRFVGPRTQVGVRRWLRSASVFALPCVTAADGNQDALPTVLLEAGASGIPCIATRTAGIPEIIDHERTGLVVEPGDPAALADALERCLASAPLRHRMGLAARERMERLFDAQAACTALTSFFRASLDGPRRDAHARDAALS